MKFYLVTLFVLGFSTFAFAKKSITEVANSIPENFYEKYYTSTDIKPFTNANVDELNSDLDSLQAAFYSINQDLAGSISLATAWAEITKLIEIQKRVTTSYRNYCESINNQLKVVDNSCPSPTVEVRLKTLQGYLNTAFTERVKRLNSLMDKTFLSCGTINTEPMYGFKVINENLLSVTSQQIIDQNNVYPLFTTREIETSAGKIKQKIYLGATYLNRSVNTCFMKVDQEALLKRKEINTTVDEKLWIDFEKIKVDFKVSEPDIENNSDKFKKAKEKALEVLNSLTVKSDFRKDLTKCITDEMNKLIDPVAHYGNKKIEEVKNIANRVKPPYKEIYDNWNQIYTMSLNNSINFPVAAAQIKSVICEDNVTLCINKFEKSMYVETSPTICGDYKTRYSSKTKRPSSVIGVK